MKSTGALNSRVINDFWFYSCDLYVYVCESASFTKLMNVVIHVINVQVMNLLYMHTSVCFS